MTADDHMPWTRLLIASSLTAGAFLIAYAAFEVESLAVIGGGLLVLAGIAEHRSRRLFDAWRAEALFAPRPGKEDETTWRT